jgi:hypothetical protein
MSNDGPKKTPRSSDPIPNDVDSQNPNVASNAAEDIEIRASSVLSKSKMGHIRNSTAEFLIFSKQKGESTLEVRVEGETVWLSQRQMALLFGVSIPTINEHINNIYEQNELKRGATIRDFLIVQSEGKRSVSRKIECYNLDAIIGVGFRVNSKRAIEFRQWATIILRDFAVRGYVLDKERLKNGQFLGNDYFDHLVADIQEIRASERRFYQKITDIYATSMDYNGDSETTQKFFATIQNKLHYSVHGHTAAEVIVERADSTKDHMGLVTWKNGPRGKILKPDVSIAKNYLSDDELESLNRIAVMYIGHAIDQAERHIPMTMEDWVKKLNAFLQFTEREVLDNPGKVSAEVAKAFAEGEYGKYRKIQDHLFESDFDRHIKNLLGE